MVPLKWVVTILRVRITDFDGSNPINLERAKNITEFEAVNTPDEGVSFDIAKNDPKAEILNPDTVAGFTKFWEVWETTTNERLNYGSITSITEQGSDYRVVGAGRSSLLADFRKSKKTFYTPIDSIVDDLRYENLAIQPRTTTLVPRAESSASQTTIFGSSVIRDEKYAGLSKQTKDNAIDDNFGLIKPGEIEPPNTYFSTDSYWAGQSVSDSHVIDLGDTYDVSKLLLILPWWGGIERKGNRTYDFEIAYADDTEAPLVTYQGKKIGPFHPIFDTGADSRLVVGNQPGASFYLGATASGIGLDDPTFYTALSSPGPVNCRYIRTRVYDVHAWYGSVLDTNPSLDGWDFQCDPDYQPGDFGTDPADAEGIMTDKVINERVLEPANDCFASIVEMGVYQEILSKDEIKPLALQRIDNNNLQIIYNHIPDPSETITTPNGFRKFEPGGFFRQISVDYSGANTTYNKFYDSDCAGCYPDGFNFGVIDQNNSLVISRDQTSGVGVTVKSGAYTSLVLMKGASDATVTLADSWPAITDPLSWGGSYSYTTVQNDYAILHFRGQSLKWYATIPTGETGATVKIEIRNKNASGTWTAYSTLETGLILPNNIASEVVYEITYESGILAANTVYQLKITNLNGGYCSIDSFEGYWSASMTQYNEDNHRINVSAPERLTQVYDSRFSGGSMYRWNNNTFFNFHFEGDRVVILSAKGRNHGKLRLILLKGNGPSYYDEYPNDNQVFIPGGSPTDGSISIDLETSRRGAEITQFVAFDSNEYFPNGLPWGKYLVGIYLLPSEIETYTTTDDVDANNFIDRCSDCTDPTGEAVEINKYVYLDAIAVHEKVGLSISFENETHLDILRAVAEAVQAEWDVTEQGVRLEPRIGIDTEEVLREGQNTLVDWQVVNDVNRVASILVSTGADIDGLPLFAITENKETRQTLGRTVMRQQDFRNIADYFQLIGMSRTELKKRQVPEKRITVTHISSDFTLRKGDSFILYTKKMGPLRVRIMRRQISNSSSSGRTYELECIKWPLIT
jgi:hypothetical protein